MVHGVIHESPRVAVLTCTGQVELTEVLSVIGEMRLSAAYVPGIAVIADTRGLTKAFQTTWLASLAGAAHPKRVPVETGLVAVLVSRDVDFGIARIFEMKFGDELHRNFTIVHTWAEALTALGLTESELPDPGTRSTP
jgi:hypothetical protein